MALHEIKDRLNAVSNDVSLLTKRPQPPAVSFNESSWKEVPICNKEERVENVIMFHEQENK